MRKNILTICLLSLLTSCAFHKGNFIGSAVVSSNNFKTIKLVSGESSTTKVFGIGGCTSSN